MLEAVKATLRAEKFFSLIKSQMSTPSEGNDTLIMDPKWFKVHFMSLHFAHSELEDPVHVTWHPPRLAHGTTQLYEG